MTQEKEINVDENVIIELQKAACRLRGTWESGRKRATDAQLQADRLESLVGRELKKLQSILAFLKIHSPETYNIYDDWFAEMGIERPAEGAE